MLAGTGAPFDSDDYLFEVKWDGIRVVAFFGDDVCRLQGRKLGDATARYPEIERSLRRLPGSGILDGEVVVLDPNGRPDFHRVLVREQTSSRDAALVKATSHPVVYMAFDLLYRDGESLVARPLHERKERLADLLAEPPGGIVFSTHVVGRGKDLFAQAKARDLEGVVAKRLDSRYLMGERSNAWLKLKVKKRTEAVVIGIVREPHSGRVKSLVLGARVDGKLAWLGNVGSGLDQNTVSQLGSELGPLKAEAPEGVTAEAPGTIEWLRPALVVRVEYSELTPDRKLRHPVFIGFIDGDPDACDAPER